MKPKKIEKKLDLSKKTIADLSGERMIRVRGGVTATELPGTACTTQQTYCLGQTCAFTDCNCTATCDRYCTFPPPKGNCTQ